MPFFECSVTIRAAPERLFDFHTDTDNLVRISPRWFKTKVLRDEGSGAGRRVDFRVTSFGIPTRWQVTVSEFDRPHALADVVTKGPFKYFHHRRVFGSLGTDGTTMTDRIEYELPLGVLGRIADRLFVRRLIESMFRYRHKRTKELLDP